MDVRAELQPRTLTWTAPDDETHRCVHCWQPITGWDTTGPVTIITTIDPADSTPAAIRISTDADTMTYRPCGHAYDVNQRTWNDDPAAE